MYSSETGLTDELIKIESEGKNLREQLDKNSKLYQKYLEDLSKWEKRQIEYLGDAEKIDTIEYYQSQLKYLESTLKEEIELQENLRTELVEKLFDKKVKIIEIYKSLFKPVSEFISGYKDVLEEYHISVDVNFKIKGFVEKFFNHISLGSKGSFIGNPSGLERLELIIEESEFGTKEGIIKFLKKIIKNLKFDQRQNLKDLERQITEQLKTGYEKSDLYSFLFELDFLEPEYRLKLGDKIFLNFIQVNVGHFY